MHRFQPTRSSLPIKPNPPDMSVVTDVTQSANGAVAPELQHLTAGDIDILDAVIRQAGPTANTFFTIFKAYSDVLKERGLDPQEVVYYGKLLKLGTLKGKNWGDKWEAVKAQAVQKLPTDTLGSFQTESTFRPYAPSESQLSDDQYSSVSRTQVSRRYRVPNHRVNRTDTQRPISVSTAPQAVQLAEKKTTSHDKKFSLNAKEFPILASITERAKTARQALPTSNSDDEEASSSPVPPSYKSTAFDLTHPTLTRHTLARPEKRVLPSSLTGNTRHNVSAPKEKAKVVDLDDAWKNLRMEQDEKFADKFREDVILARCWEMWRQGFLWITTTHHQIDEARDKLVLKQSMQRWKGRLSSQLKKEDEMVKSFDAHRTKIFWRLWQAKLKQKRQIAWRNDMRQKLRIMKTMTDDRIVNEAWKRWRQLHFAHLAEARYETNLMTQCYASWRNRLLQVDDKNNLAAQFLESTHFTHLRRSWLTWKNATAMRKDESIMVKRVQSRTMMNSFDLWRKRMALVKVAISFRDKIAVKRCFTQWKSRLRRVKLLENRAEKHLLRQDECLLRAIIRIWGARMRGKRLEQLKIKDEMKNAWRRWQAKMDSHNSQLNLAFKFAQRSDALTAASALVRWHQVLTTHRNANQYAIEFEGSRLRARALLLWRLRLRDSHDAAKLARLAKRYFVTRRVWKTWIAAVEERKRQERLKRWELSKLQKIVNVWRHRAKEGQYFRQCEAIIQDGIKRRIISNTLARWTNRVIDIKSLELDVVHRYEASLMKSAFVKWEVSYQKHIEAVSLLENYLLVKQENVLRRGFQRWLGAKRAAEHRRINHQRKEEHLRQLAITSAWERWRERFKEEKLRPLEYELILANQRNTLSWAFTIWLSKTFSLPAVRFHSKNVKRKFFQKWRDGMPNVLRIKKARETDRYNTIVRTFEKWTQAYKTKITLKAVARAKSLRLPPTSPRQVLTKSRPLYGAPQGGYSRRLPSSEDEESQLENAQLPEPTKISARIPPWGGKARSERSATRSEYAESNHQANDMSDIPRRSFVPRSEFMRSKPRSERSVPRSDYGLSEARQPSPVRSIVSMPDRNPKPVRSSGGALGSTIQPRRGVAEGGTLWTAMKDLPQRRPRNL